MTAAAATPHMRQTVGAPPHAPQAYSAKSLALSPRAVRTSRTRLLAQLIHMHMRVVLGPRPAHLSAAVWTVGARVGVAAGQRIQARWPFSSDCAATAPAASSRARSSPSCSATRASHFRRRPGSESHTCECSSHQWGDSGALRPSGARSGPRWPTGRGARTGGWRAGQRRRRWSRRRGRGIEGWG